MLVARLQPNATNTNILNTRMRKYFSTAHMYATFNHNAENKIGSNVVYNNHSTPLHEHVNACRHTSTQSHTRNYYTITNSCISMCAHRLATSSHWHRSCCSISSYRLFYRYDLIIIVNLSKRCTCDRSCI